jgi:hypothetical protein
MQNIELRFRSVHVSRLSPAGSDRMRDIGGACLGAAAGNDAAAADEAIGGLGLGGGVTVLEATGLGGASG